MNVTTAVIPVAGAGSRMFPGGTAIEKCMQPVYAGDKCIPLAGFMVEDCAAAGITRIIFVTTERGRTQLRDYFDQDINPTIVKQLNRVGKSDTIEAELQRRRTMGLQIEYVVQNPDEYGTAVSLHTAQKLLAGEKQFALMGGDDFVYHQDGTSELGLAIAAWKASGADHAIMGLPIARSVAGKYGILQTNAAGNLLAIDEKPPEDRWPEAPVANISRYLFSDTIWPYVAAEMAQPRGLAEHYITYPINTALAAGQSFYVHSVKGVYLDGGTPQSILAASQYVTAHPHISRPSEVRRNVKSALRSANQR